MNVHVGGGLGGLKEGGKGGGGEGRWGGGERRGEGDGCRFKKIEREENQVPKPAVSLSFFQSLSLCLLSSPCGPRQLAFINRSINPPCSISIINQLLIHTIPYIYALVQPHNTLILYPWLRLVQTSLTISSSGSSMSMPWIRPRSS